MVEQLDCCATYQWVTNGPESDVGILQWYYYSGVLFKAPRGQMVLQEDDDASALADLH